MKKILVICRTQLDNFDTTEVTELLCPPIIGHHILVRKEGKRFKLKIISICHCKGYIDLELGI